MCYDENTAIRRCVVKLRFVPFAFKDLAKK